MHPFDRPGQIGIAAARQPASRERFRSGILLLAMLAGVGAGPAAAASEAGSLPDPTPEPARYVVRMSPEGPLRLTVTATIPIDGAALEMDDTRPAILDELGSGGWPSLIRDLEARDEAGKPVDLKPAGAAGWVLAEPHSGRLVLKYRVDYSPLAQRGWPAPREAAYADSDHFASIARALFILTPRVNESVVRFEPASGWRPVTPWRPAGSSGREFAVRSGRELAENFVVLSRIPPDEVSAGGFRLLVLPMGDWNQAGPEIRRVLGSAIRQFVRLMDFRGRESYLVVLLPIREQGGESFRNSFASSAEAVPSRDSLPNWANTIAHEIFHYWNGWRLHGADYPTSQWFHEGFTEYAANLALVAGGAVDEAQFRARLSEHVRNYRKLTSPLAARVTHKGPPLYGGGALVAFCWDVRIREASGGKRNLGDFLRALWDETGGGGRPYEWRDIQTALERTARGDWDAFYRAHIRGREPLPLEGTLALVGLRLGVAGDGSEVVEENASAGPAERRRWKALAEGW